MNPPPQPLSKRKLVQLMVILTILAWATQTLFHQWGYGATLPPTTAPALTTPTLEIRESITLVGGTDILLSDIARFSRPDAPRLARLADIPIAHFALPELSRRITTSDIRATLTRARINPASIRFSGSTTCLVTRTLARSSLASDTAQRETGFQPVPQTLTTPTTQPTFIVHPGDFLTVTFDLPPTKFQTILRATQQGSLHATIKAQNESTGATHLVTLTSPTEATWTPRTE
jgi:hypothetical protein